MSTRVVISDGTPPHGSTVRSMILAEHAGLTEAECEIRIEDFDDSLTYAGTVGAVAVVRSTQGLTGFITDAEGVYPDILCFVPLRDNTATEAASPTSVPAIVTCGGGDTDNDTAYGPGLEFWDLDSDSDPGTDYSSYANGRICGKLLYIKDTLLCTWWEARYRARMTASGAGTRTDADGYGLIDADAAIAYAGDIPIDPYAVRDTYNRLLVAKNDIIEEFRTISEEDGFETTPKRVIEALRLPQNVNGFPEIGVVFGVEKCSPIDAAWSVINSTVPVEVVALVKGHGKSRALLESGDGWLLENGSDYLLDESSTLDEQVESVRNDMRRVIAGMMKKYMNTSGHYWMVTTEKNPIQIGSLEGKGTARNIAAVGCRFDVKLRNQTAAFT